MASSRYLLSVACSQFLSSASASASFRNPGSEKMVRTFEGVDTEPFKGTPEVKEEEERFVVTYTQQFFSESGKPIQTVEYVPKNTLSSTPIIERDLGYLNLSSSSSDSFIPPPEFPFPWVADDDDGFLKILSVDEITSKLGIMEIRGEVECTNCHQTSTIGFHLKAESFGIGEFVVYCGLGGFFSDHRWLDPALPPCPNCRRLSHQEGGGCGGGGHLKPVIPEEDDIDYKKINWLFLFLGEMLGCCSVQQLNLFCKHITSDCQYRQKFYGAKDRLLYFAYVTLCKQLYPTGPFNPIDNY